MLLGVSDHFLERFAFVSFAGCLSDFEQLDDGAAVGVGVLLQSVFLYLQRKPFAFLLTTADSCQIVAVDVEPAGQPISKQVWEIDFDVPPCGDGLPMRLTKNTRP